MDKLVLFDIDHTLFDTEKFRNSNLTKFNLYNEVWDTLKSLSKVAKLGIFSKGDLGFQKAKLKNTGIDRFFNDQDIHIFPDKILNVGVLNMYKSYRIFFVDDRLEVLREVKKYLSSVYVIWIKQGPHAQGLNRLDGFIPDKEISDLKELSRLVANN